jgi:hypothetical protein
MNENPYTRYRVAKKTEKDGYTDRTLLIGSNTDVKVLKICESFQNIHILTNCYHSIFPDTFKIIQHGIFYLLENLLIM